MCRQTPRGAPPVSSQRVIQYLSQLEGQKVLGGRSLLGLQPPQGILDNAVVCNRLAHNITTQQAPKATTPIIPTHLAKLWSKAQYADAADVSPLLSIDDKCVYNKSR